MVILSPAITVNGLALSAILSPADANAKLDSFRNVLHKGWADISEVETLLFLSTCPRLITREIPDMDGDRHLV